MDIKLSSTELEVRNVTETEDVKNIVVGLLGVAGPSYQLKELVEALVARKAITATDLTASAAEDVDLHEHTRDYSGSVTRQLEAAIGKLFSIKVTQVTDTHRDIEITRRHIGSLEAAGDDPDQQEFEFSDADIAYLLEAGADFEYDADECAEVLDSLHDGKRLTVGGLFASGVTPKKFSGDYAQASILTANGQEQVLGMSGWNIDWKRKTVEATTTDDAAYESSLGSTKSWGGKADMVYIDGEQTQVDAVLSVIDTGALDAVPWNFFPTVAAGRAALQGQCIIDSLGIETGMGKILGLKVSFKGTGPLKRLVQAAPVVNPNTVTGLSAQV